MSRHTQGPWRLLDQKLRPQFAVRILEIRADDGAVVAWGGFDGIQRPKAVTKANARLITAAPDLLVALKALAKKVDATSECDHSRLSCEEIGCIGAELRLAYNVIAKAEGA